MSLRGSGLSNLSNKVKWAAVSYGAALLAVAYMGASLTLRARTHWVKGDFVPMRRSGGGKLVLLPPSQETLSAGVLGLAPVPTDPQSLKRGAAPAQAHLLLGPPKRAGTLVRRDILAQRGDWPRSALVWASGYVYNGTPAQLGLPYQDVWVNASIGKLPAWHIPAPSGRRRAIAIVIHGHGGQRAQELRMLPALQRSGVGALYTTFRNADGAPKVGRGELSMGAHEAKDMLAALRWARDAGYGQALLYGFSMGGNVALSTLALGQKVGFALPVVGVLLDSPVLDWREVMAWQAQRYRVPKLLARPALRLAQKIVTRRTGVNFDTVDHLHHPERLTVPALLWHGERDRTVPISQAEAFAAARPDLVEYHRVKGAKHIKCWNINPEQYDAQLVGFVGRVLE